MDGSSVEKQPRKTSQKRQRNKQVKVNFLAEEFNLAAAKAARSGLSLAAFARAAMLGDAGPRAKSQLPVDAALLRQVLAQHGRYGNNMNQIAYVLNAEGSHKVLEADFRLALKEWAEIRDTILAALGRAPHGPASPGGPPSA